MTSTCYTALVLLIACGSSTANQKSGNTPVLSHKLLNFLYLFDGYFSDVRQIQAYESEDEIDPDKPYYSVGRITPVEIPALAPEITYLFEQRLGKILRRRVILIIWEDDNEQIFMQPYNITTPPNDMSKPFTAAEVMNLTASDLTTKEECKIRVDRVDDVTYKISWPDCTVQDQEVLPTYEMIVTCDSIVVIIAIRKDMEYDQVPIIHIRTGPRFQPLRLMVAGNLTDPCHKGVVHDQRDTDGGEELGIL
ncbi:uncharacterized protein LOC131951758 [Physella acuta]|uniref:uncharacterized protein LOC131951758 n=1 Tax=Physella acuta TaxID=109671 RepID=UPI0027DE211C|nr:uncharacterized protein LOC131951758 [Physella acuta]